MFSSKPDTRKVPSFLLASRQVKARAAMKILYPSAILNPREADDIFEIERAAANAAGISTALFSLEQFQANGQFPSIGHEPILYRGWMMPPNEYERLYRAAAQSGEGLIVDPQAYRLCHYLPSWYAALSDLTPETVIFPEDADIANDLRSRGWTGCFLKDYVKSLGANSMITDFDLIPSLIAQMKKFRGRIEGGICARRIEEYRPDSERRHFVFRGDVHSFDGSTSSLAAETARRINSPFFSVDTVIRQDGVERVIEIGDGQVSDLKEWTPAAFVKILG